MKAIVQSEYGAADVLAVAEVAKPVPKENEVLVSIAAASVHAGDWHLMRGQPFLLRLIYGGWLKPKISTIGTDMAGRVEAVGAAVTQFQPGDEVFGDLSACGFGAFAEYVAVPETALGLKPDNLTLEQAATVPVSALAALHGLRDVGQVQPGQKVLIKGASGGVGSYAVQMAKAWGATVTALCSPQKMAMVRSLGADEVVDSQQIPWAQWQNQYDLIFDAAAYRPFDRLLPMLKPQGIYVMVGGDTWQLLRALLFGGWLSKRSQRQVKCLMSEPNQADLATLKTMIEAGQVQPMIDRRYTLSEVPEAMHRLEQRQVQGKVVIVI
ncbi:NAD(P)-dependent alcohol dehydrogenase [Alkalinema pantanalense CENA528]|uniref:NAD(P)-dependent alcohol dehydrogenase n=1 Tax=Alkalinema pantanalense TaxID=1620705 RepID=UPI003D6DDEAC